MLVDPDGMQVWIPEVDGNGNVNYIAEEGDNAGTLSVQFGIGLESAERITGTKGNEKIEKGTRISGEIVKQVTGSDILKLDLMNKDVTSDDMNHQIAFAISYERVVKESLDGNLNEYFTGIKEKSQRTAGGMFYGFSTTGSNPTTVRINDKILPITFAVGSQHDGRFETDWTGEPRDLPNGRRAFDHLYPRTPQNQGAVGGLKNIRTISFTVYIH